MNQAKFVILYILILIFFKFIEDEPAESRNLHKFIMTYHILYLVL